MRIEGTQMVVLVDGLPLYPDRPLLGNVCRCLLIGHRDGERVWVPCPSDQVKDSPFCAGCVSRHPEVEDRAEVGVDTREMKRSNQ